MKTETAIAEKHISIINWVTNEVKERNWMSQTRVEQTIMHCLNSKDAFDVFFNENKNPKSKLVSKRSYP
jgi:hypothetical protein